MIDPRDRKLDGLRFATLLLGVTPCSSNIHANGHGHI